VRPILAPLASDVMPLTIVQKTIGAIIMRTSPTNPSLNGFSDAPACGQKWPTAMPSPIPSST
jgi:hypothetical protein